MGVRLHFVVEGQTEEMFVNEVLAPHLSQHNVWADVRLVQTGKTSSRRHKGGLWDFSRLQRDVCKWIREDSDSGARFTTMVDLYHYPKNAPGYEEATQLDPYERVNKLEERLAGDIESARFIPYIQLHEFETLLYSDLSKWGDLLLESTRGIRRLADDVSRFRNIELIDDGETTAPSKRILQVIPEYDKVVWGSLLALNIGLPIIRGRCSHFDCWLTCLEGLGSSH